MLERFFLSIGCSWTFSTIFPFILIGLITLLIMRLITKRMKRKPVKILIICVVVLGSLGLYFALEPIYEGDFSNSFTREEIPKELKGMKSNELVVLTIPNCPYCMASIELSNNLLKRNKNLKITYIVLSSKRATIKPYKAAADKAIRFKLAKDLKAMAKCADSSFPSFVMVSNDKLNHWSNNSLGPKALDAIEDAAN